MLLIEMLHLELKSSAFLLLPLSHRRPWLNTLSVSFLLKMPDLPLVFTVCFHWPDGADRRGSVGEGVPLPLDAGVVRVERFADADDVQARLVGQLGQEL